MVLVKISMAVEIRVLGSRMSSFALRILLEELS